MLTCSCSNGADCHPVTGACVCAPGFTVSDACFLKSCTLAALAGLDGLAELGGLAGLRSLAFSVCLLFGEEM